MEMEEYQKIDLEFEADGLLEDKQFSENSVGFSIHELKGGLNTEKDVNNSLGVNETDHLPELHQSTEPERNQKPGRYNLRKSLAWDSAFFTNAGVLDAEELTTMITGANTSDMHLLPGIQEEITGSTESLSTLCSDTLTMETFEDDMFVDIRASIKRSSRKASNLRSSNIKIAAMEVDSADVSSLKKEDLAPQHKIPKPGLKKISSLQTVRPSKCPPKGIGKLGSEKATKQDSVQSQVKQMSIAKIGGVTNSVLPKPPKHISSSIPSSTAAGKHSFLGTGRDATVSGIWTRTPKVSSLTGARTAPAVSSSTVHSIRSSISSGGSSDMSSRMNPGKSNLMMPRRNTAKSSNFGTGPPVPKPPSRAILKNKTPLSSKISSSVSPASSISEWSSASSSSSSMANQKSSTLRASTYTNSCRSVEGDTVPLDSGDDVSKNQGLALTTNYPKKSSTQTGGNLHAPGKLSGLRMPSHKFGFFDGVKPSSQSPNRHPPSPSAAHTMNGPASDIPVRSSNSRGIVDRSLNTKPKTAKAPTVKMTPSPSSLKRSFPKLTSPRSTDPVFSKPTSPASFEHNIDVSEILGDFKINTEPAVELNDVLLSGDVAVNENQVKKDCDFICEANEKENCHDKYAGEGLAEDDKGTYRNVNGSINEILSDKSGCAQIGSDFEVFKAPLALKNSFVGNECSFNPKEN